MFGFYVTYWGSNVIVSLSVVVWSQKATHNSAPLHTWFMLVTEKTMGLHTFKGNPISTDGGDGIIDIILGLERRVDLHYLKVHRNTAEPST